MASVTRLRPEIYGDPAERRPIFIVGMNGSGTTMLRDCLDRHSNLYGFPRETRLIPYLMRAGARYEPLTRDENFVSLWNYVNGLTPIRAANGGEPMELPSGWERCTRDLAGLLNMLFLCFANRQGGGRKTRWCEKSPQYGQHMARLSRLYPQAKFLHLIRDGRDCAQSFHRRWQRSPELTMVRWKMFVRVAREQGAALGARYLEVRYEDLTSAPEIWMRRICRFLEEPFEPAVLRSAQPYLAADPGEGSIRENSGRWRSYFSHAVAERLERIAGRALAECGYQTAFPDSDATPPLWRQHLWWATDAGRQFLHEVAMKAGGRIERSWRSILMRPINAYRQRRENQF